MSCWIDITDPDSISVDSVSGDEWLNISLNRLTDKEYHILVPLSIVKAAIEKHEEGK